MHLPPNLRFRSPLPSIRAVLALLANSKLCNDQIPNQAASTHLAKSEGTRAVQYRDEYPKPWEPAICPAKAVKPGLKQSIPIHHSSLIFSKIHPKFGTLTSLYTTPSSTTYSAFSPRLARDKPAFTPHTPRMFLVSSSYVVRTYLGSDTRTDLIYEPL